VAGAQEENAAEIQAIDLGDLLPIEILKESIRRNASHGRQLDTSDKRKMAGELYDQGMRDEAEMADLLSITAGTLKVYLREAKQKEKEVQKAKVWDLWLDCCTEKEIAASINIPQQTINGLPKSEWIPFSVSHPTPPTTSHGASSSTSTCGRSRTAATTAATSAACRRLSSKTCCGCTPSPATSSSIRSPAGALL
jgi:hypothetical protein